MAACSQMDGYEATRCIRRWEVDNCDLCRALELICVIEEKVRVCPHHRLPIVAVTADVMKGTHEQCFSAGMDDYIPKVNILTNIQSMPFYYVPRDSQSIEDSFINFSMMGYLNKESINILLPGMPRILTLCWYCVQPLDQKQLQLLLERFLKNRLVNAPGSP